MAQIKQAGVRAQLQLLYDALDPALEVERKSRRLKEGVSKFKTVTSGK